MINLSRHFILYNIYIYIERERESVGEKPWQCTPNSHIFNWINVWKKICPERDLNPRPPITSRVWSPLHHQDNHAGNTAIEEVIYVVKAWASREIFFRGDKVGEPITSLETQPRIKLMMHNRSQLSGWQGRILEGYRLILILERV